VNSRRQRLLADLQEEEQSLAADLRAAREQADAYERALLTEQSAALKDSVARALTEI